MRHIERTYTGNYDGTVIQQLTGNDLIYLCDHGILCFGEKAISAQVSLRLRPGEAGFASTAGRDNARQII